MLDFGTIVVDTKTGYSGRITGRAEYDNGVILYLIELIDHDGDIVEMWRSEREFQINH